MVLPVVLMLLWGIIEFGFGWRDKITVETAARAGARTASNLKNTSLADYYALASTVSALSSIPSASIDYVVIFNATVNDISTTCKGGTGSIVLDQECNVYTPAMFSAASTNFGCGTGKYDNNWCPTTKRIAVQATGTSYVGVYVKVHRAFITNQFGTSIPSITASAVMRLEPLS
jgi:Flp pilus assembly protein TadG